VNTWAVLAGLAALGLLARPKQAPPGLPPTPEGELERGEGLGRGGDEPGYGGSKSRTNYNSGENWLQVRADWYRAIEELDVVLIDMLVHGRYSVMPPAIERLGGHPILFGNLDGTGESYYMYSMVSGRWQRVPVNDLIVHARKPGDLARYLFGIGPDSSPYTWKHGLPGGTGEWQFEAYYKAPVQGGSTWRKKHQPVYCQGWPFWVPVDYSGGAKPKSMYRLHTLKELGSITLPEHPSGFPYQGA
jgi:hypothetical protein